MTKLEPFCPKAIANRAKARARQKLKWYCESCKKQCRDENGFKCHCSSEGHLRLLGLFGENPQAAVESYSALFERAFLEHLQLSHYRSRVSANLVYNDYIGTPHHVHMNATKWATLTEFVTYLGKEGICKVDHTPKGWFITYQGHKADALLRDNLQKKRRRADMAYEERQHRALLHQIDRAAHHRLSPTPTPTPAPDKVSFSLHPAPKRLQAPLMTKPSLFPLESASTTTAPAHSSPPNAIWISPGLVVKVTALNRHYKKKGVVHKVLHDKQIAVVQTLDTGDTFHGHQDDLQTVIPQLGALVRIVRGTHRGSTAQLLSLDTASFSAAVRLDAGPVLPSIEYENICKFL